MKNLIYSPFVLFIVLLAASCQKEPLVSSSKKDAVVLSSKTIQPQDSLVSVSMINNSSTSYEVALQGTGKYTVDIQANSRQVVSVKAGTYNIEIYPTGASSYASHTISWGGLAPINGPRANLNVLIPLASSQALLIY